jgi:hypothetical protein
MPLTIDLCYQICSTILTDQKTKQSRAMSLLKKEARARLLESKEESLLDDRDLNRLWELLMENICSPPAPEKRVCYHITLYHIVISCSSFAHIIIMPHWSYIDHNR